MVLSFTQDWAKLAPGGMVPSVFLAVEHYNRIVRLTERGIRVRLALDLYDRLHKDDMKQAVTVTAAVLWQAATQPWE
jgi:hypothetical protein